MKALGEIIYFSLGIEKCLTEEVIYELSNTRLEDRCKLQEDRDCYFPHSYIISYLTKYSCGGVGKEVS